MTRTQIINGLIKKNNYETYLEIGVNTPEQPGYNWVGVDIKNKHGVDPNVDTTFKMTSDEFFENHIKTKYDIIFIDGLHLFEQVERDINNSLENLNNNGTIVVHDTNPVEEITQRRERASDAWHGDVWKAILKLRLENPNVSIHTVDTDEGCTIIKKGKQDLLKPKDESVNLYDFSILNQYRKKILMLITPEEFTKIYL